MSPHKDFQSSKAGSAVCHDACATLSSHCEIVSRSLELFYLLARHLASCKGGPFYVVCTLLCSGLVLLQMSLTPFEV